MDFPAQAITLINSLTNSVGGFCLSPIAATSGWLSITLISAVLGVMLLLIFKYTSNQKAIASVRDDIKANLLAIKLFRENITVTFRSQARVFICSFKLLFHSVLPMLVMLIPVSLTLAQMSLWYQFQPLSPGGEPAIVKVQLNNETKRRIEVKLIPMPAVEVVAGPIHILSRGELYWKIKPLEKGHHVLTFQISGQRIEKQLIIGEGLKRLSPLRPGPKFSDILLYPLEKPFTASSVVSSISIDYPERQSYIYGTDWWIFYFFIASMVFALAVKPIFKVRI